MTERLYYNDSYLWRFEANVVAREADGLRVYLDRTAFYPTSGGQLFDTGTLGSSRVVEVADEGDRIVHLLDAPLGEGPIEGAIDGARRLDFMRQHTGQHLLSAVIADIFGFATVSVHLGESSSTVDLAVRSLEAAQIEQIEQAVNDRVTGNVPVTVSYEDAETASGLRKASDRGGTLRIVSIEGLDRSACGGTHVRSTGEIGTVLLRKLDRVRDTVRLEFLCGPRAIARARADFRALAEIAQAFSAPADETPQLVRALRVSAADAGKQLDKLETQLAVYEAKDLHAAAAPDATGCRLITRRLTAGSMDALRRLGTACTSLPGAVLIGLLEEPPSILLASSADSGVDAGKTLKEALQQESGRGGGSPRMAQGTVPSLEALDRIAARLSTL